MTKRHPPTIPWEHARRRLGLWPPHYTVQLSAEAIDSLTSLSRRSRERIGRTIDSLAADPFQGTPTPEDSSVHTVQVPPCVVEYRVDGFEVAVVRIRSQGKNPVVLPGHFSLEQVAEIAGWKYPRARRWLLAAVPVRKVGTRLFAPAEAVLTALLYSREGAVGTPLETVVAKVSTLTGMTTRDLSHYFRDSGWRLEGPAHTAHVLRDYVPGLAAAWRQAYPPQEYLFPQWIQEACEEKN